MSYDVAYQIVSMHESEDETRLVTISIKGDGPVKAEFTDKKVGNTWVKFFVDIQRAEDSAEDFVLGL
jgi:hypothetical protein